MQTSELDKHFCLLLFALLAGYSCCAVTGCSSRVREPGDLAISFTFVVYLLSEAIIAVH